MRHARHACRFHQPGPAGVLSRLPGARRRWHARRRGRGMPYAAFPGRFDSGTEASRPRRRRVADWYSAGTPRQRGFVPCKNGWKVHVPLQPPRRPDTRRLRCHGGKLEQFWVRVLMSGRREPVATVLSPGHQSKSQRMRQGLNLMHLDCTDAQVTSTPGTGHHQLARAYSDRSNQAWKPSSPRSASSRGSRTHSSSVAPK